MMGLAGNGDSAGLDLKRNSGEVVKARGVTRVVVEEGLGLLVGCGVVWGRVREKA